MVEVKAHSLLSPSGSSCWIRCPGAPHLCATLPEEEARDFTEEGTAAHDVGERALKMGVAPSSFLGEEVTTDAGMTFTVNEEMVEALDLYVGVVHDAEMELGVDAVIEGRYTVVPDLVEGTADAAIIGEHKAIIVDLKYGKGEEVFPELNTQQMIYGIGALLGKADLPHDFPVELVIVQPRIYKDAKVKRWETTWGELMTWKDFELDPAVELAKVPNEVYRPSGKACKWCRAARMQKCPTFEKAAIDIAEAVFADVPAVTSDLKGDIDTMDAAQLVEIIEGKALFKKWVKSIEERFAEAEGRAKEMLKGGFKVPGYKLVAGRKTRKWKDEDVVSTLISPEIEAYDKKLKSPAQLEKAYKAADLNPRDLDVLIESTCGEALAPESSKKKALPCGPDAVFADVK